MFHFKLITQKLSRIVKPSIVVTITKKHDLTYFGFKNILLCFEGPTLARLKILGERVKEKNPGGLKIWRNFSSDL